MSDLLTLSRAVTGAMIFRPSPKGAVPEELPSFDAMLARLRELAVEALGPAAFPLRLGPGRSAFPDLDPFWSITVTSADRTAWVCTVADRWADADDMNAALAILRRAFT